MLNDERIFRLRAGGVECDLKGPRVGDVALLKALDGGWTLRPAEDLRSALESLYQAPIDVAEKLPGLAAVAKALNDGDLARAQVATLLLRLPDPRRTQADSSLQKLEVLFDAGWLGKDWDPAKHPRTGAPPNPGWFAPTDGGANARGESEVGRGRAEGEAQASTGSDRGGARVILVAGVEEDDEKFPWEDRDDEEEGTFFNPDTGKITRTSPGVSLGPPWIRVPNISGPTYLQAPATQTWVNPNSLERHFDDHADEFGARDEEDYAAKANDFYLQSLSRGYRRKADSNGVEYIYDPKTNTFGSYTADGRTITFFKPEPKDYWDRQPGFLVKIQFGIGVTKTKGDEMDKPSRFICPICGYPELENAPRTTSGAGSYEICPCCGFEFGYHDDNSGITYDEWRRRWVAALMPWKARRTRPPLNWNPVEQLRRGIIAYHKNSRDEIKPDDK